MLGHVSTVDIRGINNSPYVAPAYSAKFDGNGKYSPQYVEDFTDSNKFDSGVGGGIDQDNHPYPRGLLAQGVNNSPYKAPAYSAKFDGAGKYSPQYVEDFTDSNKFDSGVGGGIDQDNHPYPRGLLAQGVNNSPYKAPAYSAKFDGAGKYSPQYVEDFTDSNKFDSGVGGGIDQDNHPYPRGMLSQKNKNVRVHDHMTDYLPINAPLYA